MYKNLIKNKKAIIFDLDGTVVGTEPIWRAALLDILEKNGGDAYDFEGIINSSGLANVKKWQYILETSKLNTGKNAEALTEETQSRFLEIMGGVEVRAKPGFWELAYVLKQEKGLKLALATNTNESVATKILQKIELNETFDYKFFGDTVKNPKPDPEIYIKAMKEMQVKPSETLIFEDSPAGVEAAIKSNADVVLVWNGESDLNEYPEGCVMKIVTFEGLPNNLDQSFEESYAEYRDKLLSRHGETVSQQTQKQPR